MNKLGGMVAVLGVSMVIWGDRAWGWGLLLGGGVLAGGAGGIGGLLIIAGLGTLARDDIRSGLVMILAGLSLLLAHLLVLWQRRWRRVPVGLLNKAPSRKTAAHAELSIAYVDAEGQRSWRRISVHSVTPLGARDMRLRAFCHHLGRERSFRLSRIEEMIDLETDQPVANPMGFLKARMAAGLTKEEAPASRPPEGSTLPVSLPGQMAGLADLLVSYAAPGESPSWRHISLLGAEPSGWRDLSLQAYCHDDGQVRTFSVARIKEMIDLETDAVIRNKFTFVRDRIPDISCGGHPGSEGATRADASPR
ncbi:MAG: hypothetical protein F8N37_06010 [Telmatospirillum sp.]|nr:hypothetical protein [Telmatospirillum sp.]